MLEHNEMVERLASLVRGCDDDVLGEGCSWYDGYAQRLCRRIATDSGLTENQAVGLVAAYNINASWAIGLKAAATVGRTRKPYGLRPAREAAQAILDGQRPTDVLGHMPKIGRFYRNIAMRDYSVVTVDRWAARAATGLEPSAQKSLLNRAGVYERIEDAYIDAGHEVGLEPAFTQAVCWIATRGSGE